MADTKTTALTAATSWASGDLLYMVRDPAGTPVSRKITVDNILQNLVCAANTSLIKSSTGYSLTGSNASSMIDLAGTWNTSGNPVALKMAITNTASGSTAKFIECLGGAAGTTQIFNVDKLGAVRFASGNANVSQSGGIDCNSLLTQSIQFFSGGTTIVTQDTSNTLAIRNGANAQAFRLYGTYTDASNYRRLITTMSTAGVAEIKPDGAGTGASGNVLHISGLPTSNPGPGILWNNAGTPAIGT